MNAKEPKWAMTLMHWRSCALICGLLLAGCTLRSKPQAAVPPPPPPVAAPAPAPEPQLSIPQTTAQLPSPQPVNPDAIPPAPPEEPPAQEKPAPRVPRRTPAPTAAAPAKAETETPAPAQNAAEPAAAPFQPILTAEEQIRLRSAIDGRQREIEELKKRAKRHFATHNKPLLERIESFLSLSDKAAQRGDYTQADALSERALLLARELKVE